MKRIDLEKWYLDFISKEDHRGLSILFYWFLAVLSHIYGAVVAVRNLFFDIGLLPAYRASIPVISIGNISWGGSGKTTLTLRLLENFQASGTVVLRRGYGTDEEKMFIEHSHKVYSAKDRVSLARFHADEARCFILDDGFQYRWLKRDINIVVMAAREFQRPVRLLPLSFFREPLSSLRRADIVIVNYKSELPDPAAVKSLIVERFPECAVYFADYIPRRIVDMSGREYSSVDLSGVKIAAVTAIGYPQGFFNKIKAFGITAARQIVYPDHYELDSSQIEDLCALLIRENITHIIVTNKDKNRFRLLGDKVTILLLEIGMVIEDEASFIVDIKSKLKRAGYVIPVN